MEHSDSGGQFGSMQPLRRISEREARRKLQSANDVVPVGPDAGLDHQALQRSPMVLHKFRCLGAGLRGESVALELHETRNRQIFPEDAVIMARGNLVESGPLDIDAELQMVRAESVHGRKIGMGDDLLTVGVLCEVAEKIAALAAGQDLEGLLALWTLPQILTAGGEAELGERAAGKVDLILDRGEVQILAAIERGFDRTEERESASVLIGDVSVAGGVN